MWTNINNLEIAANLKPGSVIAIDPDTLKKSCVVTSVNPQFIEVVNCKKKELTVIMPQKEVISGKWWVEHKLVS